MKIRVGKASSAIIFLFIFLMIMFILTISGISDNSPEVVFFIYLIGLVLFLLLASDGILVSSNDRIIFWGATFLKVAYALYRFPLGKIADPALGGDAGGFWRTAVQYYEGNFSRVYTPFPHILNFEFHIFGKNVLCCCVTNIVLSMLMVLFVIKIMNDFEIYGSGRFWAVFLSAFLIWGIIVCNSIWREAVYFALITGSFVEYIDFVFSKRHWKLFISCMLMIPVLILHIGYFPIVAVYIIDYFHHEKVRNKRDLVNRSMIIIIFAIFIVFATKLNSVNNAYVSAGYRFVERLSGGESSAGYYEEAGSRYLAGFRIVSLPTLVLYSPLRLFFYLFSPLPTNCRGLTDIVSFLLDSCVHILYFVLSIRGIRSIKKFEINDKTDKTINTVRILKAGLWAVLLCGFLFGLGTSTAGTAIRHRDVMIGIESIQIGISLSILKGNNRTITKHI